MNDPVLNRKLFRHKAQIIHKQIPKLQQGGAPWYGSAEGIRGAWQAGPGRHLWDFNRGAGFNTAMLANPLKKAKFAGDGEGYRKALEKIRENVLKVGGVEFKVARGTDETSGQVVFADPTFDSNKVTIGRGGSNIGGIGQDASLLTESQSVTLIYVDSTKGWIDIHDSTSAVSGNPGYIVASG